MTKTKNQTPSSQYYFENLKTNLLSNLKEVNTLKGNFRLVKKNFPAVVLLPKDQLLQFTNHLKKANLLYPWQVKDLQKLANTKENTSSTHQLDTSLGRLVLQVLNGQNYVSVRNTVGNLLLRKLPQFLPPTDAVHFLLWEPTDEVLKAFMVAQTMSHYDFKNWKSTKSASLPPAHTLTLFQKEAPTTSALLKKQATFYNHLGESINLTRHLVNIPPNIKNPTSLSQWIQKYFGKQKNTTVKAYPLKHLEKEGMGLFTAVSKGSEHPAQLVAIKYRPKGCDPASPYALVGKGITFDTGGLDLKPSRAMRLMKKDMGGAAGVIGVMNFLTQNQIKVAVDAYLAFSENSVDKKSMRPGDIFTARNNLKVEIHNTDAEGRLVLADTIHFLQDQLPKGKKYKAIIDMATLTGAIKVGLGSSRAGFFSNDDKLARELENASKDTTDTLWKMPLDAEMEPGLNSQCADLMNCSDGFGGAITAALFLQKFVHPKTPWAHIDMYAWVDQASGPYLNSGGRGQGVELMAKFFEEKQQT